jgi:hypothetical protein
LKKVKDLSVKVNNLDEKANGLIDTDKKEAFEALMKLRTDILKKKEALENKKKSVIGNIRHKHS